MIKRFFLKLHLLWLFWPELSATVEAGTRGFEAKFGRTKHTGNGTIYCGDFQVKHLDSL